MTISSFRGENAFLSNFHPSRMEVLSLFYDTVEHAYQALKSKEMAIREDIRNASTPGKAKILGQPVEKGGIVTLRDDWEEIKVPVMASLIKKKFKIPELRILLLATGDQTLIEGNWWNDTFWGVCNGIGKNNLGKILMAERAEIRFFG